MEHIQFIYFQYYMQYYTVHHKKKKKNVYGNLASWMMVRAQPTTASLFWFYYNYTTVISILFLIINYVHFLKHMNLLVLFIA